LGIKSFVNRIASCWRQFGLEGLFSRFTRILHSLFFEEYVVIYWPLSRGVNEVSLDLPVVFRRACMDDLDELRGLDSHGEWDVNHFSKWLRRGDVFFVAVLDGRIIGYACAGRSKSLMDGLIRLDDYSAEGFSAFVLPEFRGRHIGRALVAAVANCLREDGFKRVMGFVGYNNIPARRAYRSIGYIEAYTLTRPVSLRRFILFLRGKVSSLLRVKLY